MSSKILLIDGNSFCYRAFYAIRGLATSGGVPTNAIFGFVTMLNKLISEHKPEYLAVAFDLKGPTFRHRAFDGYKAKRKPMPDELVGQLPAIKEVLRAYNIATFERAGYEADDIIATLVKKLDFAWSEVLIVTGDKDILQLVSDKVKIINPHQDGLLLGKSWVKNKFGVEPEQIVEIMALAGDPSDNIPGVPGIGEATAIELIREFGSLEEVLAHIDEIPNKSRSAKIRQFAQQARLSKELATLDFKVMPLAQKQPEDLLKQLTVGQADRERLFNIFRKLEFWSLLPQVTAPGKENIKYEIVKQPKGVEAVLEALSGHKSLAVYLHASQAEPMRAEILSLAFSLGNGHNFFFPLSHFPLQKLKPVLEDKDIKKIGHDLKYLAVILSNYGITLAGLQFDTLLAAYLLDPARGKYSLPDLALRYLHCKLAEPPPAPDIDKTPAKNCCTYAEAIFKLSKVLQNQLRRKELFGLFLNIELPLITVLADMEKAGVGLDKNFLLHLSGEFEAKLKSLTKQVYEIAGMSFNINSPKQLAFILFERLKLPRLKRTKTGSSTDYRVLQRLAGMHPVAGVLLDFREFSKLKSTYVDGLIKLVHPRTKKIHTFFNQAGTATGRLSSRRPNLQNIPIKTPLGRKIRRAFVPKNTNILLSADYSQIELRILAHLSADKNLITAFRQDRDVHCLTAALIFDVSLSEVTQEMRDTAKTVNFGIIYGISPYGLAEDLRVKQDQAQRFIDAYFQRYPQVAKFISRQIKLAEAKGFVTTLLNRRRYIPEINSQNENQRQFAQRMAINAPVQGSASDLIKAAMVAIYRNLKERRLSTQMLIQVHDELVFDVPEKELPQARELVKTKMEDVIKLKVPIKATVKTGQNWLEMK